MTQIENQTTADRGAGIEILSTPAELDLPPAMAWSSRAADPIRLMRNRGGPPGLRAAKPVALGLCV